METTLKKANDGSFILTGVRGAYPNLYEAKGFKGDAKNTPRYGITVLIPKSATAAVTELQTAIQSLAADKHKVKKLAEADSCLTDGDGKTNEALHGHWVLSLYSYPNDNTASKGRPTVINLKKEPITKDSELEVLSGDYINVKFDLYAPNGWKKISGGLRVVQRVKKGATIGFTENLDDFEASDEVEDDEELPDHEEDFG